MTENYEMIEGAQLSNSFIILLTLKASRKPKACRNIKNNFREQLGKIYKPASTLKDSLEKRLEREEYVKSSEINKRILYSITEKRNTVIERMDFFFRGV